MNVLIVEDDALPPELIDCTVIVERALTNLHAAIEEHGAMDTHATLPTVAADATQPSEVFQNLIGNAIKYCHTTPWVAISAHKEGAAWLFSVRDNGIGVDSADAERIVGIFQRALGRGISRHWYRAGHLQADHRAPWRPHLGRVQRRRGHDV